MLPIPLGANLPDVMSLSDKSLPAKAVVALINKAAHIRNNFLIIKFICFYSISISIAKLAIILQLVLMIKHNLPQMGCYPVLRICILCE